MYVIHQNQLSINTVYKEIFGSILFLPLSFSLSAGEFKTVQTPMPHIWDCANSFVSYNLSFFTIVFGRIQEWGKLFVEGRKLHRVIECNKINICLNFNAFHFEGR